MLMRFMAFEIIFSQLEGNDDSRDVVNLTSEQSDL